MIKRFLKRALSTLLCTIMIISSGLSNVAYADGDINANVTGGTFNLPQASAGDAKYAEDYTSYLWINPNNCGLRVTVIDRKGNAVSNSVDILEYNVFELLQAMKEGVLDPEKLAFRVRGTGGSEGGHGAAGAHRNTRENESEIRGFIRSILSKDKQGRMKGVDIELDDGGYEKVYNNCIIMTGHKFDDTTIDSSYGGVTNRFKGGNGLTKYKSSNNQYIKGSYNGNKITTFNAFDEYLSEIDNVSEQDKDNVFNKLKDIIPSKSDSGKVLNDLLNIGAESGNKGEIAKVLMNWKDGNEYLFEYTDTKLKKQVSEKKPPIEVARDNKFKIIVEPVVWCVPFIGTGTPTAIFRKRTTKTEDIIKILNNQLFGYISPYLVYGSVTQVCVGLVQDLCMSEGAGCLMYGNPAGLKTVDSIMYMGPSELLQACLTTYITSKDDPEILYNGMQLYSPAQHKDVFPLYDGKADLLPFRAAITGDVDPLTGNIAGKSFDFWRIVGYGCGVLDVNEIFRPSTGTSTPGTPVGPTDATKHSKLVKIYLDKDGDGYKQSGYYVDDKWYAETVSVVDETHEDGKEYKVYSWKVSKEDKDLSSYEDGTKLIEELGKIKAESSGEEPNGEVTLNDKDTLYVVLTNGTAANLDSAENQIVLHQNELAHTFRLSDINKLQHLYAHFGQRDRSSYDYCTTDQEDYSFSIRNSLNYNNSDFIGGDNAPNFKQIEAGDADDENGPTSVNAFDTEGMTPNLQFSLYRNKNADRVTMYPNKGNDKNVLKQIGITNESYKYSGGRKKNTGSFDWVSNFTVNYKHTHLDNHIVAYAERTNSKGYTYVYHPSATGRLNISLSSFNALYSKAQNVKTKGFTGNENTGDAMGSGASNFSTLGMTFNRNMGVKTTNNSKFIEFYPYFGMTYQTSNEYGHDNSGNHKAYLTASNLSKLSENSYVEAAIFREGMSGDNSGYGIGLQSEQWSTHKRTIKGLEDAGLDNDLANHSLIPGGAILNLSTANADDSVPEVWLGVRAYEVTIPDNLKNTLNNTDVVTTSEAKSKGVDFYNQIQTMMKGYQLEKWIKKGIALSDSEMNSATKVSGKGAANKFEGNTLQNGTGSKYYLKTGKIGGNGAQFSLTNQAMEQHVYNIKAEIVGRNLETDGMKVIVSKDGSEIANVIAKSKNDVNSLLTNAELKLLDDKTAVIRNFFNSLDIGLGKSRLGNKWYYEAQDGIDVVETSAKMQIIFGDANGRAEVRSEVVDPKLCGKLDDHSDIINFDEDKTRTVQYRMSDKSLAAPDKSAGYIGTFNGMDICLSSMNSVMRTRLSYMSNNTVMDLN